MLHIAVAVVLHLLCVSLASPLEKRGINGPVIASNFPDPSWVLAEDSVVIAFGSHSGGFNVPTASSSTAFKTWALRNADALPTVGAWSTGNNVVTPDVIRLVRFDLAFYVATYY